MTAGAASRAAGISGFALYLPRYRVDLRQWCVWTGNDAARITQVIGDSFRLPGADENVYTMAVAAVLRLIRHYRIDPQRIGMLVLATESSSDNAVGAVIVRGLVDEALCHDGQPPLASDCEVPEIKQACLAGVYGLKQAVRYVQCDGAGRQAIVVSADIAEYARGSSGEPTQGAGAVAMLVEGEARIFALDLAAGGSASRYRIADFRKPLARFCGQQPAPHNDRLRDFPVFNGKYSTACYTDTMLRAFNSFHARHPEPLPTAQLQHVDAIFMHRPYDHMPVAALSAVTVQALLADTARDAALQAACRAAEVDPRQLHAEAREQAELVIQRDAPLPDEARPLLSRVARTYRRLPDHEQRVTGKLALGRERMREMGNLYTAALPAWLAVGASTAMAQQRDWTGRTVLLAGYGSGDAAEVIPARVVPGWESGAARIDIDGSLAGAVALDAAQYQALHAGQLPASLSTATGESGIFAIDHVGRQHAGAACDAGIAWYARRSAQLPVS